MLRRAFLRHAAVRSIAISAICSLSFPVQATSYLSAGVGDFNVLRSYADAADFTLEYRGNPFFNHFLPVVGAQGNSEGGKYGFAGIQYDWEFLPDWIASPSAVAGAWSRGESAHLGGTVEFREGLELDYRLADGIRIGGRFTHMSNADIYRHNPGAETASAIISVPFGH